MRKDTYIENKVVRIVIITDHSEMPYTSTIDSVWNHWTDASMRVDKLNKMFEEDKDCDLHAHYTEEVIR